MSGARVGGARFRLPTWPPWNVRPPLLPGNEEAESRVKSSDQRAGLSRAARFLKAAFFLFTSFLFYLLLFHPPFADSKPRGQRRN